ncbi:zinc ribbon domain-containing protein [Mediterraneibacter massiliensis]|uniref:zinc ribbon domain-containing protein n=1 Tax=Mediterraneibacter massiliensis TaxID=1720300 RepID=UPI00073ED86C|nr:zinc ribbon domain-containing protein [Mediterraneibacter massiliensis]
MFCKNCGTQLTEGVKFCPRCGTPIPEQKQTASQQTAAPSGTLHTAAPSPKKPGSKKKIIIPCVVAGAVLIVSVGAFAMTKTNAFKARFTDPVDYYKAVETAYIDKNAAILEKTASNKSDSSSITMGVDIDDAGIALLGIGNYDAEMITNGLNELELQVNYGQTDDLMGAEAALYSGKDRIVSANTVIDSEYEEAYIQIPEISSGYLWIDEEAYSEASLGSLSILTDIPDTANLSPIFSKYAKTMLDYVEDVERETDELKVDGIAQKTTHLTVTMDDSQLQDLFVDILETAQKDEDLKDYIVWLGDCSMMSNGYYDNSYYDDDYYYDDYYDDDYYDDYYDGEAYYDSFIESLDNAIIEIEEYGALDEAEAEMDVWVDKNGAIIGRTLTVSNFEETMEVFNYQTTREKDKFACVLSFGDPASEYGDYVLLEGNGSIKKGLADGTFTLESYGETIGEFTLSNYDLKSAEDGYFNGTLAVSSDMSSDLYGYGLEVAVASNADGGEYTFSILSNDVSLGSIHMTYTNDSDYTPKIPDSSELYNVMDYEDMYDYEDSMDLYALEENCKKNEFLSLMLEEMY